jgi:hypothetical protein
MQASIAGPTMGRGRVAAVGVMVTIGLVATGCSRGSHAAAGAGRLVVDGQAELAAATGAFHRVGHVTTLHRGDRVHLVLGTASINLSPDGLIELRTDTRLRMDDPPFLETGDVLVEPSRHTIRVGTDQAEAQVTDGVTRLTRTLGLTAKSYVSTSALQAAGRPVVALKAPRQASVTDRDLLPRPQDPLPPLSYDDTDPWDHRYLARAEALGRQLTADASGFSAQLSPSQGHTPGFYKLLLPKLNGQAGFDEVFNRVEGTAATPGSTDLATPGNYLLAAAVALAGKQGTFAERWTGEFAFARSGADWGLVSYDQGVSDTVALADDVLAAIGKAPLVFTLPLAQRTLQLGLQAPASTTTTTSPETPPTTTRRTSPPTTGPPTTLPKTGPLPQAPATGITPVDKLLDPLLNPLVGLLNGLLSPPPPAPHGATKR